VIEIEAVDMFVEKDPESGDDDEGDCLISLRVPNDREFSRQLKELGAKWVDAVKEWQLVGNETTIKQIGALCKAAFPGLPRRRNRLVATQVSTSEGSSWPGDQDKETTSTHPSQVEVVVEVEFVVNRTIKTYRRGQNLKWVKEFRQVVEQNQASQTSLNGGNTPGSNDAAGDLKETQDFVNKLQGEIRELERVATEAFEALLLGRKEAVSAILREAGIKQI
jgi:hypothetical protein